MPRPETSTVLRTLVEILEDPAPINPGHAQHVSELIHEVLAEDAPTGGSPLPLAALSLEDPSAEDPAL
ncbi:hypothetical protein MT349_04225 [Rathayibacter caricis]|uniref:hypothetical protein n=1 Tax=Rathayibacter caricis TaxID=110936 RepID=UPI001FB330DF|nr:hypothetical protein [Rathayibacter caricis]MCJ1694978.1 hypothetical protein [Rathayibacter caricis]